MDTLVIGPPRGLADAVARALRRQGREVLQALPADARDAERAAWLLEEAGQPSLVVAVEAAPYPAVHELLALTRAEVVLVAEQRAAVARPRGVARRATTPRDEDGLTVVALGRAGRLWFDRRGGRAEPLSPERAAALVLRACGAAAASCR